MILFFFYPFFHLPKWCTALFMIVLDLCIATVLYALCALNLKQEECTKNEVEKGMKYSPVSPLLQPEMLSTLVATTYVHKDNMIMRNYNV